MHVPEELTGFDGQKAIIQEGVVDGTPIIKVRVFDALVDEHAISIAAHILTARGNGDAELMGTRYHQGAYEVWYRK